MRIPSGTTDQYVYFIAVDATDFTTRETGLTSFTVYRSRNGGAAAAMTTPTVSEVDATNLPGVYTLLLDEDMTIDAGDDEQEMVFHISHAGMAPVTRAIELYRPKITGGYTLGVAADGDLLEVNTLTGHTVQTGDSYARIGAAGASLTALGGMSTAMKAEVNAEADTALTDYGANTTTPPTTSAIAGAVLDEALSGHATAGTLGKAVTDIEADTNELQTDDIPGAIAGLNDPTAAAIADQVWEEALADHSGTSGSTAEAVSNASAPTAAAVADAVWDEAIADHSGTGGSTAEALSAAGGSSGLREIKGTATYNSATKELRVLAWLELSAVVQDATAATLSFKNDAGAEVLADGSFTKAENADNTWLWTITDGSAINAVKNYMATVTFTVGGTNYTRTFALAGAGA